LVQDASPGSNKALLTLSNGRTIQLDSAGKGQLAMQGDTRIIQLDSGLLSYQSIDRQDKTPDSLLAYNTITTPRGGQYQVVLPDGSRVWLNAASSLRFPAVFAGSQRIVQLKGEAYFEVAPRNKQPFIIHIAAAASDAAPLDIDVLGTHFNVNAYGNEPAVRTTLLTGSIRIRKGIRTNMLRPGQQSIAANNDQDLQVNDNADLEEAVAWKNGMFIFNNLPLESIMRQIERWYDMEVSYRGNLRPVSFNGQLSRYSNVSRLLELLQTTGEVHFTIENKKIIVRP
jgi:ferric-dicitrate binding protein FerR (iron transport regulator)